MAQRPIFIPITSEKILVDTKIIDFTWHPGMSVSQKQKSIISLHKESDSLGIHPILEISTKSPITLGIKLSAFNLKLSINKLSNISVEASFQGSKVFQFGGPYRELYQLNGRQIKKDERLKNSGRITQFDLNGSIWPLYPTTVFYDWLYINALYQNPEFSKQLINYSGFSDIEFNPKKSINCQARAAALYLSLFKRKLLEKSLSDKDTFLDILSNKFCYSPDMRVENEQYKIF